MAPARYIKQVWADADASKPVSAARMGAIETGIFDASSMQMLQDSTAGGAVASFDFTSIISTFSHLLIECQLRGDAAAAATTLQIRFNNDTAANYDSVFNTLATASNTPGGSAAQTSGRIGRLPANTAPASAASTVRIDVANYVGTTLRKACNGMSTSREAAGALVVETNGVDWFATAAAINRITLFPAAGNFVTGSRVTIYGLG